MLRRPIKLRLCFIVIIHPALCILKASRVSCEDARSNKGESEQEGEVTSPPHPCAKLHLRRHERREICAHARILRADLSVRAVPNCLLKYSVANAIETPSTTRIVFQIYWEILCA